MNLFIIRIGCIITCSLLSSCSRSQTEDATKRSLSGERKRESFSPQHAGSTSTIRLVVQLRDGSRLAGTTSIASLPFSTLYGRFEIPLAQVSSVTFVDSSGAATAELVNGDLLHGRLISDGFPLRNSLGALSVPLNTLVKISVGSIGAGITEGLVAYYPLDASAADASGHGHDAVNHGATPGVDRFGRAGRAFQFDGTSAYIGLPNGLIDPAGNGFTWSVWTMPKDTSGEHYLLYGGANTAESGLDFNQGKFNFVVKLEDGRYFVVSAPPQSGEYIHIACIYRRGESLEIWINGRLASRGSVADGVLMHGSHQHSGAIGSYAPEQPNHMRTYGLRTWSGLIDEVRIYERPLGTAEIEALAADH